MRAGAYFMPAKALLATPPPERWAGADTAGMDHSTMAHSDRAPAKDADHEFLHVMSDHHEGLIGMASAAMNKASTPQHRPTHGHSGRQGHE